MTHKHNKHKAIDTTHNSVCDINAVEDIAINMCIAAKFLQNNSVRLIEYGCRSDFDKNNNATITKNNLAFIHSIVDRTKNISQNIEIINILLQKNIKKQFMLISERCSQSKDIRSGYICLLALHDALDGLLKALRIHMRNIHKKLNEIIDLLRK